MSDDASCDVKVPVLTQYFQTQWLKWLGQAGGGCSGGGAKGTEASMGGKFDTFYA